MPYADAFDEHEPLGKPFLGSLALHAGVVAIVAAGSFIGVHTPQAGWAADPQERHATGRVVSSLRELTASARGAS